MRDAAVANLLPANVDNFPDDLPGLQCRRFVRAQHVLLLVAHSVMSCLIVRQTDSVRGVANKIRFYLILS